jgi:outer membrane protein assembly factor BamB
MTLLRTLYDAFSLSFQKECWKMFRHVLLVIALLISLPFGFVLIHLLWRISHHTSLSPQRTYRVIGIVFLVLLVSGNILLWRLWHISASLKSIDWSTYHDDNMHTGYAANEPDPNRLIRSWTKRLDNAVYAEPLVVGERLIVATEGDTLYSLDARTGQVQWRTTIGHPIPLSTLNCSGTIDLIGITGTPVYDPVSGLVFAVAEVTGPRHLLVGVDVNTGKIGIQRSVDVPEMDPPRIYLQRPALALSHGMVYIAFGGLHDDCGQYHGTIIASQTDGMGPLLSYQVPTHDSGGIWGASGPVIDQEGHVYVATGNEDHMTENWDWDLSNAVLRLSPTLKLEDSFAPAQWRTDDTGDNDLGSMGPSLLPGGFVFIAGKSGFGYLLHTNALGGIGGQAAVAQICNGLAMGGAATVGSQVFVPCSDGLRRVLVEPGPKLTVDWHALALIDLSPIVGGNTVYSLDQNGILYALDIATGMVRTKLTLGFAVPHFVTPTISDGHIFVGTIEGVVAVALAQSSGLP